MFWHIIKTVCFITKRPENYVNALHKRYGILRLTGLLQSSNYFITSYPSLLWCVVFSSRSLRILNDQFPSQYFIAAKVNSCAFIIVKTKLFKKETTVRTFPKSKKMFETDLICSEN